MSNADLEEVSYAEAPTQTSFNRARNTHRCSEQVPEFAEVYTIQGHIPYTVYSTRESTIKEHIAPPPHQRRIPHIFMSRSRHANVGTMIYRNCACSSRRCCRRRWYVLPPIFFPISHSPPSKLHSLFGFKCSCSRSCSLDLIPRICNSRVEGHSLWGLSRFRG